MRVMGAGGHQSVPQGLFSFDQLALQLETFIINIITTLLRDSTMLMWRSKGQDTEASLNDLNDNVMLLLPV